MASGTIVGGVFVDGGGIVIDSGVIEGAGGGDAVAFAPGAAGRLAIEPTASFIGTVDGGNPIGATAVSTLELAAGTGTLTGVGTQFVNFGSIVFDPGAQWFVAGNTTGLSGTISGFAAGDTIDITGITVTGLNYESGVLTLTTTTGATTLDLPGNFTTADFGVADTAAGAELSFNITVVLHAASSQYEVANDNGSLYMRMSAPAATATRRCPVLR